MQPCFKQIGSPYHPTPQKQSQSLSLKQLGLLRYIVIIFNHVNNFRTNMPSILIAYPIDHTSLILADKLRSENDIDLTFFIDPSITNEFMTIAVNDLKSVSSTVIKTTVSQVNLNNNYNISCDQ